MRSERKLSNAPNRGFLYAVDFSHPMKQLNGNFRKYRTSEKALEIHCLSEASLNFCFERFVIFSKLQFEL